MTACAVRAILAVIAVSALRFSIGIVTIACNVALVLGSETVVALANGDLCRDPERTPRRALPNLESFVWPRELARLADGETRPQNFRNWR